jgi:hypothetical protein
VLNHSFFYFTPLRIVYIYSGKHTKYMAAGKYSFIIEQGATTNFQINWTDESGSAIDLTGYQGRMQIRTSYESSPLLSLSSSLKADGTGINLSGSNGTTPLASGSIAVYISAASSSLLEFGEALYDLEMVKANEVTRLLEGKVKLSKNVTK